MTHIKLLFPLFLTLQVAALQAAGTTVSSVVLSSTPNPGSFGAPVALTATLSPGTATGKVAFYDGATLLGTSPVTGGEASLSTILLAPGSRVLHATYSGDTTYALSTSATLTQSVVQAPDGGFATPPTPFGTFAAPISAVVGDFNHDGKADLAVVNITGVAVLLGNGEGTFQTAVQLLTGSVPAGVAEGDFNGDGNMDLAVMNENDSFSVLLGNGNGTFQAPVATVLTSANLAFVVVGDFNGDGNADLAAVDSSNGQVDILLGKGDGTFQPPVAYAVGSTPSFLVAADLNGDGKIDLAVANAESGNVSILMGNGNGTFQMEVNYGAGETPNSIAVGDFNGDGKPDLAVANQGGSLSILLGNGDGTFRTAANLTLGIEPISVASMDFNGDGDTDLVVADYEGGNIDVLLGNGDGTFQTPVSVPAGMNPNFIAVGDFNGDTRPDFAVTDYSGEDVGIILGTPKTTGTNCTYAVTVMSPQTIASSGGSINVTIQTGTTCGWVVAGLPAWITVTGGSTGTGPESITLVVAANTGALRAAEIDVANSPGLITQLSNVLSLNAGGVVNAASYSGTVAPGSIAAVFGNFLMAVPASAAVSPLPTNLAGLTVQFGTELAPLFYASLEQVNIQVPWELAGQTTTNITSTYSGQTSVAQAVTVAAFAPGIFSIDSGTGQGAILDSTYQLVSSTNPAAAGSYVQIYCTGLGAVTNQPLTGTPAAVTGALSETMTTPVVTIGGAVASVIFSGLAPGTVGEYQINVQVPAGASSGTAVPVVVTMGGVTSNTVTMGVQ